MKRTSKWTKGIFTILGRKLLPSLFHRIASGLKGNSMPLIAILLSFLLLIGGVGQTAASTILVQDHFNDNSLNASFWTTVTTGFSSSGTGIAEQNQRIEMANRPYLVTAQQFDPITVGPLRITGRWTANSASDNLSMVTRSDAVRTINFGNVNLGIECRLEVVNNRITINTMSGGSPTELAAVSVPLGAGDVFDFEILDNGSNISFTITEVGGDGTTATVSAVNGTDFATNFVVFYNRELTSESHVAFLDDVTIESEESEPVAVEVQIDIKPSSFPNSINPKSRGEISVAILTTDTFDATTIDSSTVLFGPTGTEAAPVHSALEDVDGDGDTDMILHFNSQQTGIACGGTSASLTGKTLSGQAIKGSDSIKTVGCK